MTYLLWAPLSYTRVLSYGASFGFPPDSTCFTQFRWPFSIPVIGVVSPRQPALQTHFVSAIENWAH